jgi:predicted Rdx family selenoprotein
VPFFAVVMIHCAFPAFGDVIGRKWVARYNGPDYPTVNGITGNFDQAQAVTSDAQGNAIVAAKSDGFHVSKYAAENGRLLWEQRKVVNPYFTPDVATAVTLNRAGDVVATGVVDNDFYTAKYDAATGALLWERRYAGFGNDRDSAVGIVVDAAGDVIVTGSSVGASQAQSFRCGPFGDFCYVPATTDIYTAKYSGIDGKLIWERRYDGSAQSGDAPTAVALDPAGDVVVLGTATRKRGDGTLDADLYVVKYAAADGAIVWERSIDGDGSDGARALAVDERGDILVVAKLGGAALIKIAGATGRTIWLQRDFSQDMLWLASIAIDANGDIAAAGAVSPYNLNSSDAYQPLGSRIYTAKFRGSDGQLLWREDYSRPATDQSGYLGAGAVRFDSAGDVVISGMVAISQNPYKWRLYAAKYAGINGRIMWEKLFSVIGPQYEETFAGMVLDPNGAPIIAGGLYPRAGAPQNETVDIYVVKLAPVGQLVEISTRIPVEPGDGAGIAGFIINAVGGATKTVLVRALGPSLEKIGIIGALANPTLELHTTDGSTISNDDWKQNQQAEIEATGLAPADNREAAIVATLPAGAHTAILRGANGGSGVGLIEVYDLDAASIANVANLSARGYVKGGDNLLIGGIIVRGSHPSPVVIRALGPSLPVRPALPDPIVEVHDASGTLITNDDWRSTQQTELIASGLAPTNDREAAVLVSLQPGLYTAVVRGKGGASGISLVEVYNLQ